MGFATFSAASSCARPSFLSASGTDLSAIHAAISFLICSGGSVNFLVCGSMPDMIIVIFVNTSSYWARLQFKENIALVLKYFDQLAPFMQAQDSNLRPADEKSICV